MRHALLPFSNWFYLGLAVWTLLWCLGLGAVQLFDWDEINFAEIAREMEINGRYGQPTIAFAPFHEKPPLFAWLQLAAGQLVADREYAARLPNVLCGLVSLLVLARLGRRLASPKLGYAMAAFMGLSILPGLYFRSGLIDPVYNLFLFLAVCSLIRWEVNGSRSWRQPLEAGLWLGLALMTKGPAGGLVLALFAGVQLVRSGLRAWWGYAITGLAGLLPMAIWLVWLWPLDDGFFAREFLWYQWRLASTPDAGHGGFFGYHAVVLLLGCFPASVYAWPRLWRRIPSGIGAARSYDRRMLDLFWIVLILFSLVSTKIVHYSSLCYFPLAYLAGRVYVSWQSGGWQPGKTWRRLLRSIWGLYAVVGLLLPVAGMTLTRWMHLVDVDLRRYLAVGADWPVYTILPGVVALAILVYLFQKADRLLPVATTRRVLLASGLFLYLAVALWVGRIQQHSQGALVDFYEQQSKRNVYFGTAYHKSYVPWFYGRLRPERGHRARDWRFHGPTDAELYFSSPARRRDQVLREVPDAELLYELGGYAFYRRPAAGPH